MKQINPSIAFILTTIFAFLVYRNIIDAFVISVNTNFKAILSGDSQPHCYLLLPPIESNDDPKSWRCLLLKAARLPYFDPKCEKDGSFSPTQCDYFNTNNCWCSYKNGTRIPKTNHDRRGFDPFNCDIFRNPCKAMQTLNPNFRCDGDGGFGHTQCMPPDGWCACVEKLGQKIPHTTHHEKDSFKPDCAKHRALRFDCNPKTYGYHPHPFSCERFLICSEKGTHVCSCQKDLHYHPGLRRCEWQRNSNCTHKAYHAHENFKQVKQYSKLWPEG